MSQYSWPDPATRPLLGKKISRVDGPSKSSGRAKYTYDYNPQGLLAGKILRCPYAHAKIVSIDTSAAEKMPGVKAIEIIQKPGTEIFWAGDEIVGVAAVDEGTVERCHSRHQGGVRSAAALRLRRRAAEECRHRHRPHQLRRLSRTWKTTRCPTKR